MFVTNSRHQFKVLGPLWPQRRPGGVGYRIVLTLVLTVLCVLPAISQTLVANPQVSIEHIRRSTARAYFYMRLRDWPNGTPVRVFVLGDSDPLHIKFCREELGVLPLRLRRTWNRAVFAGLGQAPVQVRDVDEMIERVASTPGAIGYLPEERIVETVRKLTIE